MDFYISVIIIKAILKRFIHCLYNTALLRFKHREVTWYEGMTVTVVSCECGKIWYQKSENYEKYSKVFNE